MISIEDRQALDDLFARNLWALDLYDGKAFAATFTPDGVLGMREDHRGSAALEAFVATLRKDIPAAWSNHHMSSLVVTPDGKDSVAAQSYVIRVHRLPTQSRGNCSIIWSGYTSDRCVKRGGKWLFAERVFRAWEGDIAAPAKTGVAA
jgi:hypothetical protein